MRRISFAIFLSLPALPVLAGEADVVDVRYTQSSNGSYTFHVTVRHADEGWNHYADKWQVVGPDGTVLGERVLAHPHVSEQPFTRSQSGIRIPDAVEEVTVRAHDSVHRWGGRTMTVPLKGRF
ncbi:MAG: hypothetical protein R3D65_09895 [Zhengella sp.]|uniref:hypothetical protein n=1 Tax=Zhengella sp. TaxID=2282762 RepID=UPI003527BB13